MSMVSALASAAAALRGSRNASPTWPPIVLTGAARISETDSAAEDLAVARQDAQNALAYNRFAGARFADQRDRRRRRYTKRDAFDCLDMTARRGKANVQIINLQ